MAVEATMSNFKKTNLKIYIVALLAAAIWLAYDGYYNQEFIAKHTSEDGTIGGYLAFNRIGAPIAGGLAVMFGAYFLATKNKKIIAGDKTLEVDGKEIAYDSIEKINKTYHESKGFFTLTYNDKAGKEVELKLSDKNYDNLSAVLEVVVEKLS